MTRVTSYLIAPCVCVFVCVWWPAFLLSLSEISCHPFMFAYSFIFYICVCVWSRFCPHVQDPSCVWYGVFERVMVLELSGYLSIQVDWMSRLWTDRVATMLSHLRARSRSLFHSYKPGSRTQAVTEPADYVDLTKIFIKPWSSMQVRHLIYSSFICLSFFSHSPLGRILFFKSESENQRFE